MKYWLAPGIILLTLVAGTTGRASPTTSNALPRVAVGVCQGVELDQGLTDLVAVSLTGEPGIEILERADMARMIDIQSLKEIEHICYRFFTAKHAKSTKLIDLFVDVPKTPRPSTLSFSQSVFAPLAYFVVNYLPVNGYEKSYL